MSYNHTNPTVTTMNPPDPNPVPDTVKVFMRMTNERLCEAVREFQIRRDRVVISGQETRFLTLRLENIAKSRSIPVVLLW